MNNLHFFKSIVTALISVILLSWAGNVSAADTQIYPYNSGSGQVWSYTVNPSTCDGGTTYCYDGAMFEDSNVFRTEWDGVQTYKQTDGNWWGGGKGWCCDKDDWHEAWDDTKNYPAGSFSLGASTDFAQQRIKIPAGIGKITRVKFYKIYSYWQSDLRYGLILYRESTGGTQVGEIYYQPGLSLYEFFGDVEFNVNWDVVPGEGYKLRLFTTNQLMALPVSSPCGAAGGACRWWINWGGIQEKTTLSPHSSVDVYPDGYAEARVSGSGIDYFAYLRDVGGVAKADIARTAIWGKPTIPNCQNLSGPTTITLGSSGIYSATFSSPEGNLSGAINSGQNGAFIWAPSPATLPGNSGSASFTWTPAAAGTYDVFCRAWNDAVAECRGNAAYVDGLPRYSCAGPASSMTVNVTTTPPSALTTSCSGDLTPTISTTNEATWIPSASTSGGNGTYTFSWSGDEGLSGSGTASRGGGITFFNPAVIRKTYVGTGTKTATLSVSSGDGQTATASCTVNIPATPPTLGTTVSDEAVNLGSAKTSGLRITQGGGNYKNPLIVTQTANNATTSNTYLLGSAFIKSSVNLTNEVNNIYTLTQAAYDGGFMMVYATNNILGPFSQWYYNPSAPGNISTQLFTPGKFYIYRGGNWVEKNQDDLYGDISSGITITPMAGSPGTTSFKVTFYQALGSKTWKTYGYLYYLLNGENFDTYTYFP